MPLNFPEPGNNPVPTRNLYTQIPPRNIRHVKNSKTPWFPQTTLYKNILKNLHLYELRTPYVRAHAPPDDPRGIGQPPKNVKSAFPGYMKNK